MRLRPGDEANRWWGQPWKGLKFMTKCILLNSLLQIKFAGEGAIDYGGPRREFFRLLGNTIMDKYFRGKESQKFFSQNVSAIQVCVY